MPRRRSDDPPDNDPDEYRIESVGSIVQLSDKDPPGKPFPHARFPMGFDTRPGVHKRKNRKWRRVRPLK